MQFRPHGPHFSLNVMPRRHAIGIQIARRCQQILELYPFIAADTGHRRRPREVSIGKIFDHGIAKRVLIIQHIMRKAHGFGDAPRIVNIASGTARPLFRQRCPMVIKLQGDADHVITFFRQLRRHDRAVHPARHRHHHPRVLRGLGKTKRI